MEEARNWKENRLVAAAGESWTTNDGQEAMGATAKVDLVANAAKNANAHIDTIGN